MRSFYIDTDDLDVPLEAKVTEHIDDLSGRMTSHHMNVMFKIGEPAPVEVVWTSNTVAFFLRDRKLWTFQIPPPTHLCFDGKQRGGEIRQKLRSVRFGFLIDR